MAVKRSRIEFVKYLLKEGANPNKVCENGNTPIHAAFKNKCIIVIN